MALPRMFKLPENNRFEYKPLFYDKRKEEIEKKKRYYKDLNSKKEKGEYTPEIKNKFKSLRKKSYSKQSQISNIRMGIILLFLGAIIYYLISKWDLISYMFKILSGK